MGKGTLLDQSKGLPNNAIKTRFVFQHHSMTYKGTTAVSIEYQQHRQGRAKGERFERKQFKNKSNDILALALPATIGWTTKKLTTKP